MNMAAIEGAADSCDESANSATGQFLTFEIANELFAIPILCVQEIRGWEKISQIPNTPPHILGITNLRGTVVPVLDVRTRLSVESCDKTATTVVIVVRTPSAHGNLVTCGCVVDAVSDVANISRADIRPAPAVCGGVDTHFINGVSTLDERLVMLLDLARLVETSGACTAAA
jgi:purine-binding chemotaxis protein CheW